MVLAHADVRTFVKGLRRLTGGPDATLGTRLVYFNASVGGTG